MNDGKEFYKVGVKTLLEKLNIEYFSTKSDKNAAVVERFNRKLQTTYQWFDILDDFVYNYNNTEHNTILMKPKDINKSNENEVWNTLFD